MVSFTGVVNAILKKANSKTYDLIYQHTSWKKYPKAENYYDAIVNGYGFTRREFPDARPGDIIAVKFEAASRDPGHVMFIDESPLKIDPQPLINPGTTQ